MKKNIGYVNLDSSIALWLMEHLPPGELKNGIEDLLNKECSSLILESDTDELSVWDGEYLMDDSNIMAFIRKIRKKIEPNPDAPEYIVTIWGIGYKFSDRL